MPRKAAKVKRRKMAGNTLNDDVNDKVILFVDGCHLNARRSHLKNASDYFSAMFSSGMTETQEEVIEINQVDKDCLQILVDYSFTGKIQFTEETAERLLAAAVYLQFTKIISDCCQFLRHNFTPENCLRIQNVASRHFLSDLEKSAHSFALANFLDVVKTENFLQLSSKDLNEFLQSDVLKINSEDDVYEAVVSWLNSNKSVPKDVQVDLVKTVRIPFLSPAVIKKATTNPGFESVKEKLCEVGSGGEKTGYRPRKSVAGKLLAIGMDGEHIWDVYDPLGDTWTTAGTASASGEGGRYALADEILYYVGGVTYEGKPDFSYLNFSEGKWQFGPKLLQGRNNHGAAWLENALYVLGGQHANVEEILRVVEQWRPESNKWQNVAALPAPKGFFGSIVIGNKLYAVGGNDENYATTNTVYCFDPHRDEWSTCAPLKSARSEVGVGLLDGVIYAVGGNANDLHGRSGSLERYDPRVDKWDSLPEMLTPRSETAVTSLAGELFVVGGHTLQKRVGSVEIYDPSAEKWRKGSSLQSCPEDLQVFNLPSNASFFRKNIS